MRKTAIFAGCWAVGGIFENAEYGFAGRNFLGR